MADENGATNNTGSALGGAVFVKRISRRSEHVQHTGAWKIAYADFVTAMMAFFLMLWLLYSVEQESLEGIANYFAPTTLSDSKSGSGGILAGQTISDEGAEVNVRAKPTIVLDVPPPKTGIGGEDLNQEQAEKVEENQFNESKKELEKTLSQSAGLDALKKSLLVDVTPDGLRIQIVDRNGLPLFQSGSSYPLDRTVKLLKLAKFIMDKLPQKISITGHTDSVKYGSGADYTNWELSVDRANSARRILIALGLSEDRLDRVEGKSSTEPLLRDNPKDPQNRRLSIVILRGTGKNKDTRKDANIDAILRTKKDAYKIWNRQQYPTPTPTPTPTYPPNSAPSVSRSLISPDPSKKLNLNGRNTLRPLAPKPNNDEGLDSLILRR